MQFLLKLFMATVCAVFVASNGRAAGQTRDIAGMIRSAKGAFRPVTGQEVQASRAALESAIVRLDRYLNTGGQNGANWKKFLRFDEMRGELRPGKSPNVDTLYEISSLYSSGHAGFEMPVYADVGRALRRYTDLLAAYNDREAQGHFQQRIDALAAGVETLAAEPAKGDPRLIGLILGELADSRQALPVVAAVRERLSHPNLLVEVHERIVAGGINDPINDVGPVRDVILGTQIVGTAHTVGSVRAELGEGPGAAVIRLALSGTAYSNSVGRNGPAVIYSRGATTLNGSKPLILDGQGLRSLPARSRASTQTTITGIGVNARHFKNLIQKGATKRVYQSKGQAQQIASRHAEARLNARLDSQSLGFIARANQGFQKRFRYPLMRIGALPDRLWFSSTGDLLRVTARQATASQLGAITAPPAMAAGDVNVRLHESLVNNLAASALGGRRLDAEQMNKLMIDLTGKIPEELQSDPDQQKDWSITFAEEPITARFADSGFAITIRGDEYTSGERAFPAMNVTARYRIEQGAGVIRAVRQGDLEILPPDFNPDTDRLSVPQQSLARILERRFGKIFKPEMAGQGLELPGRWKRLGKLALAQLGSEGGWLRIGWNQPRGATSAAAPSDMRGEKRGSEVLNDPGQQRPMISESPLISRTPPTAESRPTELAAADEGSTADR